MPLAYTSASCKVLLACQTTAQCCYCINLNNTHCIRQNGLPCAHRIYRHTDAHRRALLCKIKCKSDETANQRRLNPIAMDRASRYRLNTGTKLILRRAKRALLSYVRSWSTFLNISRCGWRLASFVKYCGYW